MNAGALSQELRAMAAQGYTRADAGSEFGVSESAVKRLARKFGVTFPRKGGGDAAEMKAEMLRLLTVGPRSGESLAREISRSRQLINRWLADMRRAGLVSLTGRGARARWSVTEKWVRGD